jgi:hypothetical protein
MAFGPYLGRAPPVTHLRITDSARSGRWARRADLVRKLGGVETRISLTDVRNRADLAEEKKTATDREQAVLVARFTRPVLERARFGPTTLTRSRRLADASVDPTEARNTIRSLSQYASLHLAATSVGFVHGSSPWIEEKVEPMCLDQALYWLERARRARRSDPDT